MKRNVKRHAVVQPPDQPIRLIPLNKGQTAIVDAADYEWLNGWNWRAVFIKNMNCFYAYTTMPVKGTARMVYMHRFILGLTLGDKRKVDHIVTRNTLDNRRSNLRISTHAQNIANGGFRGNNTSGFKGVWYDKRRAYWVAEIMVNYRKIHLGSFDSPIKAHEAYCEAAREHHGEFANFGHSSPK